MWFIMNEFIFSVLDHSIKIIPLKPQVSSKHHHQLFAVDVKKVDHELCGYMY